jgi:DNA adenine methylase
MIDAIARPALRYHGGKWRLADWIIGHMPAHHCYVEPFGGGGSVLIQKPPVPVEVYNDLSGRVVNFFRVLREQPDALIVAVALTPYSRQEMALAREPSDDPLEAARRFFVLSWQGRGGPTARWNTGWRFQREIIKRNSTVKDWNELDRLLAVAGRLKQVQIECDDALAVIRRYDTPATLFYCDPPYLQETRSKWGAKNGAAYDHESSPALHRDLAATLHAAQGMAIVSGYPSADYADLYPGWRRVSCTARTDHNSAPAIECLWLSPAVAARVQQMTLEVC